MGNRDYIKEYCWEQKKYDVLKVKLDKKLGQKFREKLKKDNKTIAEWFRNNITKYLEKNNA